MTVKKPIHAPLSRRRRPSPAVRRALRDVVEDIVVWRKLRGLTQAQLAERAGVGVNTVRRLEDGDGGVSIENVLSVLRVLGVLDGLAKALDPYESDVGRMRSDEQLPQRVRPMNLSGPADDG